MGTRNEKSDDGGGNKFDDVEDWTTDTAFLYEQTRGAIL